MSCEVCGKIHWKYLTHADWAAARSKQNYEKNRRKNEKCRAEGRCPHCGKPCAPFSECEERRENRRRYQMQRADRERPWRVRKNHPKHGPRLVVTSQDPEVQHLRSMLRSIRTLLKRGYGR